MLKRMDKRSFRRRPESSDALLDSGSSPEWRCFVSICFC